MSNFFQRMMPDNFEELLLTSGILFTSYRLISFYRQQGLTYQEAQTKVDELIKQKEADLKQKENELIKKFKKKTEEIEKELEKNSISQEAKEYIKNML